MSNIENILKAIDLAAWDNLGKCNSTLSIPISDLETLRLYVIKLENENKQLRKKNIELADNIVHTRMRLQDLNNRLDVPSFNDYKRMLN